MQIYEKSQFQNEIGAAITITPNGMRVLDRWGFDSDAARGMDAKQIRMVDAQSLQNRLVDSFQDVPQDYGSRFMYFHRVDLHNALRRMAEAVGQQPGVPVTIHTGKPVASVDCESGTITLEQGTAVKKDLVVIADGIRVSFTNAQAGRKLSDSNKTHLVGDITGHDQPLQHTGSSFYRCLIPFDEINRDPELSAIWKDEGPGFWVPFDLSTNFFLVSYPCRGGSMLNVAMLHKTHEKNQGAEEWNTATSLEDVLDLVKGQNPLLEGLVKKSSNFSVHKVSRREPLERYTRGRAVIIGDAAHPFRPTHGMRLAFSSV